MNILFQKLKLHHIAKKCRKSVGRFMHLLDYDDDILTEAQKIELQTQIDSGKLLLNGNNVDGMKKYIAETDEKIASILNRNKMWLRETLDILAVALAVAFGIRALFFQPFKIPTGSMQPTLFGIHFVEKEPLGNRFLGKFGAFADNLLFSCERAKLEIKNDGIIESYTPVKSLLGTKTCITVGGIDYILPGNIQKIAEYAKLEPQKCIKKDKSSATDIFQAEIICLLTVSAIISAE